MGSLNKVLLIGNLGADAEVRRTPNNQSVATLRIATNEVWKDREGTKQERTEWHRVIAWGRLADLAQEYIKKGRQIYVEGRLQTRQWQDQQGQTRYTTEIVAQSILLLGGRAGAGEPGEPMGGGGTGGGGRRPAQAPAGAPEEYTDFEEPGPVGGEEDSDLPF
jgi:single-strand DNA-binding protein